MRLYILALAAALAATVSPVGDVWAQTAAPAATPDAAPAPAATPAPAAPAPAPASPAAAPAPQLDLAAALAERSLGKAEAPVTIIEFSSLTCPHCADFHEKVLPELKARYIDSGKVRLILRDFPLDRVALTGAVLARCAPADRYFGFIDVLFKSQSRWARASDPLKALAQIGKLGGLGEAEFEACQKNQGLIDGLLQHRLEAEKQFNIQSTPTFVFNNGQKRIEGALPFERFAEVIDQLLPK